MDNVFLIDDELENTNQDYINENNIIYRQPDLSECEDNKSGIYDIHKLIYKEISRENILLSSEDLEHDSDKEHDSNTLKFDLSLNKSGGVNWKKNVIGFRLNECIYTSPVSNITRYNKQIGFSYVYSTITYYRTIEVPVGYYNIHSLMNEINSQFGDEFNLKFNNNTNTVSINSDRDLNFSTDQNKLLTGLGFSDDQVNIGTTHPANVPIKAAKHPALHIGVYIDIVVDEVPYGACKKNPKGLNIIHRLPVATSTGSSIIYYKSNFIDHNYQHLFPPMNLSHLTIHLYMDGKELPLENLTISFEFELVILNK